MSVERIQVVALHCDQGMGSLVRMYDGLGRLTNLVLVDLGSENGSKRYAESAVASVMRALKQMETDKLTPRIDALIISHQDLDHWSLLPSLLDEISSELPDTEVGEIYYGGARWNASAVKALKDWEATFGCDRTPLPRAHTDYDTPGKKGELFSIDAVHFRVLAVNVPCSRSASDLVRNGTSAVMVVEFGGGHAILPGDATADTVGFINSLIYEPWNKAGKGNPTAPCRVLQAPHHGALRTIATNFTTKNAKLGIAQAFGQWVSTENVVASAGYCSKFNHPFESVLELLAVNATTDSVEHSYVVYDDTAGNWKQVDDSERGIFTTVKTLDTPPKRVGWTFTIEPNKAVEFQLDWEGAGLEPPSPKLPVRESYAALPLHSRSTFGG